MGPVTDGDEPPRECQGTDLRNQELVDKTGPSC